MRPDRIEASGGHGVSKVNRPYRERLATITHHLLSAAASRKLPERTEILATAVELGGGFAWGADQSSYISEVASMGAIQVDLRLYRRCLPR